MEDLLQEALDLEAVDVVVASVASVASAAVGADVDAVVDLVETLSLLLFCSYYWSLLEQHLLSKIFKKRRKSLFLCYDERGDFLELCNSLK